MSSAAAATEAYVIDNTHTSRASIATTRLFHPGQPLTKPAARFLDAPPRDSIDVVIDANCEYRLCTVHEHIQAEDYFYTSKYPTITFKSSSLKFDGDKLVAVNGDLTVKGVTKPVTLTVTSFHCMPHPMLKKDACGANATTKIKRSEFNAGKNAPFVSDEVTLTIPVEAVKE
jgi:polyisoprenoid-binding protein YceI